MKRRLFAVSIVLAASLGLGACGGSSSSLPDALSFGKRHGSGSSPIQHVVMIVQENRSFDNFFATFPGARGATHGKERVKFKGNWIVKSVKLKPFDLVQTKFDITHCSAAFNVAYDGGKMEAFNLQHKGVCHQGGTLGDGLPAGLFPYHYVDPSQIQPYWDIAKQWVLSDEMFQTQGSGSFTAHQDLIRGGTMIDTTDSLIDNPTVMPWGCDAPGGHLWLLTTSGQYNSGPKECSNYFPGYTSGGYQTLRDLLDAKGVSWKYYTPCFIKSNGCAGGQCSGGNCAGGLLNAFDLIHPVRYGPEWDSAVSMPETNIFTDIQNGTLPSVSWVIPEDQNSDHIADGKVDDGPSWVASVVNAVGQSQYWNSSVVVVLWDDWGGFYDNAKPYLQDNMGGLGFRVPCMIISPYDRSGSGSQGGYISHTQYEFGSILRYVEDNWNLGTLNTTDKRATSISDVFNYSQNPRQFTAIPSQHDAEYFKAHAGKPQSGDPE